MVQAASSNLSDEEDEQFKDAQDGPNDDDDHIASNDQAISAEQHNNTFLETLRRVEEVKIPFKETDDFRAQFASGNGGFELRD